MTDSIQNKLIYASVKFGYICCESGLSLEETLKKMKKVLGAESNG